MRGAVGEKIAVLRKDRATRHSYIQAIVHAWLAL